MGTHKDFLVQCLPCLKGAEDLQMLPENGQLEHLTEVVLEDEDIDFQHQTETEMTASDGAFQTGAAGDCEPIETRGFISPEIAQDLEIDAIKKALNRNQPTGDGQQLQFGATPVLERPDIGMPMNEFTMSLKGLQQNVSQFYSFSSKLFGMMIGSFMLKSSEAGR